MWLYERNTPLLPTTVDSPGFAAAMAADDNVCAKQVASTEDYVPTNLAIRANVAAVANYSARFDYRRGMNNGRHDAPCKTLHLERSRRTTRTATPTNAS